MGKNKGPRYSQSQRNHMDIIAIEINKFLEKFIAEYEDNDQTDCKYKKARAHASNRFIWVDYDSYNYTIQLSENQGERYLNWLKRGNVGLPFDMDDSLSGFPVYIRK